MVSMGAGVGNVVILRTSAPLDTEVKRFERSQSLSDDVIQKRIGAVLLCLDLLFLQLLLLLMLLAPMPEDVEKVYICLVLEPKQFEVVQLDVTRIADNQGSVLVAANMSQAVRREKRGQKLKTKKKDLRRKS